MDWSKITARFHRLDLEYEDRVPRLCLIVGWRLKTFVLSAEGKTLYIQKLKYLRWNDPAPVPRPEREFNRACAVSSLKLFGSECVTIAPCYTFSQSPLSTLILSMESVFNLQACEFENGCTDFMSLCPLYCVPIQNKAVSSDCIYWSCLLTTWMCCYGDSLMKITAVMAITVPTLIMWTGGSYSHCITQHNAAFTFLICHYMETEFEVVYDIIYNI